MQIVRVCSIAFLLMLIAVAVFGDTVHVMTSGDTIYSLARRYGVTVAEILSYNHVTDPTRIPIGSEIRIPDGSTETYTVQRGDYIYSIARRLGVDWLELLAVNNLDRDDVVRPGDVLVIPGTGRPAPQPGEPVETSVAAGDSESSTTSYPSAVADPVDWPHPGVREPWEGRFPGVVIQGEAGDTFRSVSRGVVKFVTPYGSFGQLILVEGGDGYLYAYAGADRVDVSVGDRVTAGTALGSIGFSPAFQSTKVLFAVWHNNRYVDPESAPRG